MIGDVEVDHVLTKLDEAYGKEQTPNELSSSEFSKPKVLGKKFRITSKRLSLANSGRAGTRQLRPIATMPDCSFLLAFWTVPQVH